MSEFEIQAIMMNELLDNKQYFCAATNVTNVYMWECDLLAITKSGYVVEFEIKISKADYKKDFMKRAKHKLMELNFDIKDGTGELSSAYRFYYVVHGFVPESVPDYAGLIIVNQQQKPCVIYEKPAPILHKRKVTNKLKDQLLRCLTYDLKYYIEERHQRLMQGLYITEVKKGIEMDEQVRKKKE